MAELSEREADTGTATAEGPGAPGAELNQTPLTADELTLLKTFCEATHDEHPIFNLLDRTIATIHQRDAFLIRLLRETGLGVLHTVEPGDMEEVKVVASGGLADGLIRLVHEIVPWLSPLPQEKWDEVRITMVDEDEE